MAIEDEPHFWMATVQIGRSSEGQAFGTTPEGAVEALLESWKAASDAWKRGDPDILSGIREEISVVGCRIGQGYVLGVTDDRWFQQRLGGADARFDNLFATTSPAP